MKFADFMAQEKNCCDIFFRFNKNCVHQNPTPPCKHILFMPPLQNRIGGGDQFLPCVSVRKKDLNLHLNRETYCIAIASDKWPSCSSHIKSKSIILYMYRQNQSQDLLQPFNHLLIFQNLWAVNKQPRLIAWSIKSSYCNQFWSCECGCTIKGSTQFYNILLVINTKRAKSRGVLERFMMVGLLVVLRIYFAFKSEISALLLLETGDNQSLKLLRRDRDLLLLASQELNNYTTTAAPLNASGTLLMQHIK